MLNEPLTVRAACHARISIDIAAPRKAELVIEYLDDGRLLACEYRPLAAGTDALDIKTHPEATHIDCSMQASGRLVAEAQFDVICGDDITPVARHFIVIGAMKAGTTTLFRMLARHPALCRTWAEVPGVSFPKEINYFRSLYRKEHTPLHYDWRFPFDPAKHAWTLDVSPNYAKLPESKAVPARITSLGAEVKLAYILREPVDRIESQFAHMLHDEGEVGNIHHCIRVSRYAMHLDRFTAHIPREDILLLDFEQLGRDPASVLTQVCDFLHIDRFSTRSRALNKRQIKFKLNSTRRAEFAEAVRPDVQRLIGEYGFKPAEKWLRKPTVWWRRLPAFWK